MCFMGVNYIYDTSMKLILKHQMRYNAFNKTFVITLLDLDVISIVIFQHLT